MPPKIVTFYTPGRYAEHAADLQKSAAEFGLEVDAKEVLFDDWTSCVSYKPSFLLYQLQALADGEGVLWLDADSRVRKAPDWGLLSTADFACCLFRWSPHHTLEMLTGTLFLRRTPAMLDFVKRWMEETPKWKHTDTPEQNSLTEVWKLYKNSVRFVDLPKSWTFIEPEFQNLFVDTVPTFSHLQASRERR